MASDSIDALTGQNDSKRRAEARGRVKENSRLTLQK